ncbi:TonB-dependent receptor [uncultured Duncaniella sp.]|uniref:SusC/RagA family TonB-linked outer membrane protein n=1 Tax=uncultured Duncaniella sp. TaxID=2768039 RepID=UPI0026754818|nr:TonB-dependent receptor [uncultured Duncaniella sp.]
MKHSIVKICFLLLGLFMSTTAWADDLLYQATVVDTNDEPLMGATVKVPDTQNIAVTDLDGKFSIKIPPYAKSVEITYIGFKPVTITDFSQTTIVLQEDSETLDEVVVVGYGTQKKAHLTGAISTVNMDDIADLANGNLASSLSGMVNGLGVSGGEGRPGESARLTIRGSDRLSAMGATSQEPLFVIDGFIYPNDVRIGNTQQNSGSVAFNNLDPSEIESISVLKDAAAAVYGARAANGVILVTTKRGKLGEPTISYSGSFGYTDEISRPKMLDAYNYGRLWNAVTAADPTSTTLNPLKDLYQADELNAMRYLNYDLLDKYWSSGFTQKHSVGVSGATGNASYNASISYFDQDGNLGKLSYNRWNYRAGVDVTLKKWVKASIQVSGDYGTKETPNVKVGGTGTEKDYNILLTRPRYIPESVNGYALSAYGPSNSRVEANQDYSFYTLQDSGDFSKNTSSNLNINTSVEYDFGWSKYLNGLKLRFSYSKSINNDKSNQYGSQYNIYYMNERSGSGKHLYTPIPGQESQYDALLEASNFLLGNNGAPIYNGSGSSYVSRDMNRADNYQMNFTVSYNRSFGDHTVGALFSIEKSEFESETLYGTVSDPLSFGGLQSQAVGPNSKQATTFFRAESGTLSYIGRVNYAFADKYLLEFLIRSDASTKFAPKNYWGTFPSVSLGWVASQEDWFRNNVTFIDYLKLRGSFGVTGRDNTEYWAWLQTYGTDPDKGPVFGKETNINAGSHISLSKNNAAINPDAHWDKSYKSNFGLDFNVLHNRLSFNIDGYYNWDREMLIAYSASVPGTVGTPSAKMNMGKYDSYGAEISATWRDRIGKDFSYKVTLNTGYSDNKVLLIDWDDKNMGYKSLYPGHRTDMGTWGMQCIGMFRSFQEIDEYFTQNNIISYMGMTKDKVRPGMLIYKDVRGARLPDGTYEGPDGIVDKENDQVRLSNRSNPYHVTANLNATWKGFSITAQIAANWGGYSFIPTAALKAGNSLESTNMPSFWNPDNMFVYQDIYDGAGNLVMAENRDAYYPNLAYSSVNSVNSSFWRVSGTRVQLNRLTLAYSIPAKLVNKIGVSSCRFNVTGQNLFSFYNPYPDHFMDPMSGTYGNYPNLRKFTLGVNLSF